MFFQRCKKKTEIWPKCPGEVGHFGQAKMVYGRDVQILFMAELYIEVHKFYILYRNDHSFIHVLLWGFDTFQASLRKLKLFSMCLMIQNGHTLFTGNLQQLFPVILTGQDSELN